MLDRIVFTEESIPRIRLSKNRVTNGWLLERSRILQSVH